MGTALSRWERLLSRTPDHDNYGMGSTIGVILILTMFITMWVTKEGRERWKILLTSLPSLCLIILLFCQFLPDCAFNAGDDMNSFTGFSLNHFKTMFGDGRLMLILTQTFFLAFYQPWLRPLSGLWCYLYLSVSYKNIFKSFYHSMGGPYGCAWRYDYASFLILLHSLSFHLAFWRFS